MAQTGVVGAAQELGVSHLCRGCGLGHGLARPGLGGDGVGRFVARGGQRVLGVAALCIGARGHHPGHVDLHLGGHAQFARGDGAVAALGLGGCAHGSKKGEYLFVDSIELLYPIAGAPCH